MHGMGWDGISSRGSPLLHDREWPLAVSVFGWTPVRQGVYQNIGCVAACLHGAWHRPYYLGGRMRGCVPGRRAVPACYYWRYMYTCTVGVCVVWSGVMVCQQAYMYTTVHV